MGDEILIEEKRLLPVLSVVGRSYSYVWDYRRLLTPPLAVVFLIEYLVAVAALPWGGSLFLPRGLSVFAVAIAGIVVLMTFAVGLHRTILLGDVRPGIAFLRWDANLRSYAGAWGKIFGAAFLCALTGALVVALTLRNVNSMADVGLALLAVGLPAGLLLPRFALALPSAALGQGNSIGKAWRITHGNWLRMIAVLVLATLPFWILGLLLELPVVGANAMAKLVPSMAAALASLNYVLAGFSAALRAIAAAVLTVALSLSYGALAMPPATGTQTQG